MKIYKKGKDGKPIEAGKVRRQVDSRVWVEKPFGRKKNAYRRDRNKKYYEE